MASDDMLNCPLCQGHARMSRADLVGALTDRNLREKIQKYLAEITFAEDAVAEVEVSGSGARDFQKEVHRWNPQLPIWRRSPKE